MRPAAVTTIKTVLIPVEHGASVMLGESLLAGLLIAASGKGFLPAFGWLFLYLMSHPLKIAVKDLQRHVVNSRTVAALCFCGGFGVLSAAFFVMTYLSSGPAFLLLLAGVIPFGLLHMWAVFNSGKKEFISELSGAVSLGGAAACIVLAGGHSWDEALTLWAILAIRGITSIVYVRERLRYLRGNPHNLGLVILVHLAGLFLLGSMVMIHTVKPVILILGLVLMARCGLVRLRVPMTAKDLGLQELMLGCVCVAVIVLSF